jgi:Family of unknown function (DUF6399)/helix-turn-helix, Psq domain
VGTVRQYQQRDHEDRAHRWDRIARAERVERSGALQAQGMSQRQAAKVLDVPRTTLQAWRAYQEPLDESPTVVAFFHSVPGLAFRHRLVIALPGVGVESGARGMRLVGLVGELTGRNRLVATSYGTQQQGTRHVEEAIVAYRPEESARLSHEMPRKDITMTQDETFTGGLWLVGIEPVSHSIVLEQAAHARDHDPWQACMEPALAGRNCQVSQSPSDAAPGLLAYVAQPLRAHHSPDLFQVQQELSAAVAAPLAVKPRAAAQAGAQAEETRKRVHERCDTAHGEPAKRGPGRPPQGTPCLAQAAQDVAAAHHEPQRLPGQRAQGTQSMRAIGHTSHLVDVERGVRRNGKLMAGALQQHIDTIRSMAHQEGLSETCLERMAKAERVVPTMQATSECVSGSVRQQVPSRALAPPQSFAMHAHLMPSYSLERVASARTVTAGEPLRALAERLRTPLFEPDGAFGGLSPVEQDARQSKAKTLAEVFQRASSHVEGRNGDLSLRNHQLRGLDHPRKRACLTAMHNFFLTRSDGTTAAERFFGQKPRSMFAAILESVEIPPAPLSPPRRAVG